MGQPYLRYYSSDEPKAGGALTNISCQLYKTGDEIITTGTDTVFDWQELNDPTEMHSVSSNQERIVIATAGIYLVTTSLRWISNSTGVRRLRIKLNGSVNLCGSYIPAEGNSRQSCGIIVKLVATDYLTIEVYHTKGSDLSVDNNGGTHFAASLIATA